MLEKVKTWLIHKLGGNTFKPPEVKIIHTNYPIKSYKTIVAYNDDLPLTETELARQAATQFADVIVRDRLYECEEETDMFNEGMHVCRYTFYIVAKH